MKKEIEEKGIISLKNLIHLMEREGILFNSQIVNVGVQVKEENRDRFVIRTVSIGKKPAYIVKCAKDKKSAEALKREAEAYTYLTHRSECKTIIPALISYDKIQNLIIIEWIEGDNLVFAQVSLLEASKKLGYTLAKLHQNQFDISKEKNKSLKPYMLTDLNHQDKWEKFPELNTHITQTKKEIFVKGIGHAEKIWNPNAFIHGDLKWEHCLVVQSENSISLRLIDWELATFGDVAWDIASILSDIILNMHDKLEDHQTILDMIASGEEIQSFLQNYMKECRYGVDYATMERISYYLGVRLFQTALELLSVFGWDHEASKVDLLVEMSIQVFLYPEDCIMLLQERMTV